MIQTAVLGFVTFGSCVVEFMDRNSYKINGTVREGINVKYILDLREFPESPYRDKVVHDYDVILNDPDIKIICETMGGKEPAYTFSRKALEKGISVCTSNKELVAAKGPELISIAKEHNCSYMFEASVGGGIPLLRPIVTSLEQEKITKVTGILNGTTNYILTKMDAEGADFDETLGEAQAKGYAERNPEADVEGYDTGRKIAILTSLISGGTVKFEDVYCEGIAKITQEDFRAARLAGGVIKLLGICELGEDGRYTVMTAPFIVGRESPLAMVNDVYNGILIHGNMVDDVMFYGQGAGRYPTASAVVADVVDCARNIGKWIPIDWDGSKVEELAPFFERKGKFMVRVDIDERAAVAMAFGTSVQVLDADTGEFTFITGELTEKDFADKAASLKTVRNSIRVLADK